MAGVQTKNKQASYKTGTVKPLETLSYYHRNPMSLNVTGRGLKQPKGYEVHAEVQ